MVAPNPYSQLWRWELITYIATIGGGGGGSSGVTISDTFPIGPTNGQLWWESDTGALYIWYNDGDSSQWVMICPGAYGLPQINADINLNGFTIKNGAADLDPYKLSLADMRLYSKSAGITALNNKADGTGTDIATFNNNTSNFSVSGSFSALAGNFNGNLTVIGTVTSNQNFQSSAVNVVLGGQNGGTVYLRPNGVGSGTGNMTVGPDGLVTSLYRVTCADGFMCKAGKNGATGNSFNFFWSGSSLQAWVDTVNIGNVSVTSDYRIKKEINDLKSMWETVKKLRPVSYTQAAYDIFEADEKPRWGFIAHELQETMILDAATGFKDVPDMIQSPNPWTIIAALTKTVQELQARVEALEAR